MHRRFQEAQLAGCSPNHSPLFTVLCQCSISEMNCETLACCRWFRSTVSLVSPPLARFMFCNELKGPHIHSPHIKSGFSEKMYCFALLRSRLFKRSKLCSMETGVQTCHLSFLSRAIDEISIVHVQISMIFRGFTIGLFVHVVVLRPYLSVLTCGVP